MPDPGPAAPGDERFELVSGHAAYAERALALVGSARMQLSLFTHAMDRRVYGSEEFVNAVRVFALQHRRARMRVLIHSPVLVMRGAHRLVELGRLLSSRIEFRAILEERRASLLEEYFIADERGMIFKRAHDALEARYYAHAPLDVREQLRSFNHYWEESVPARELSVLGI